MGDGGGHVFLEKFMGESLNNLKIQFPNFKIWNIIKKNFSDISIFPEENNDHSYTLDFRRG